MFAWSPQSNGCHKPRALRSLIRALIVGALITLLPGAVFGQLKNPAVSIEGVLQVLHEDRPEGGRYHYYLESSSEGRIKVKMPDDAHVGHHHNEDHQTGDRVLARGHKIGSTLTLDSQGGMQTLSQVSPNTFGPQKTLVLLVNFQDNTTQPYTTAFAEDVIFNQTSNFHLENSYGQTWLTGDVRGWFTLPMNGATCDFNAIYFAARKAASDAGINLADYSRFIYAFPQTSGCGWWGLGTVGGNPSHAWINGSLQVRVVGHETGHNLGLFHSHALDCGSVTLGTSCTPIEYGDTVDIMGSATAHYNAYQKESLGWLNYGASPPVTTAGQAGVYSIDNYERTGTAPKAIKILKSTDPNTGYKDWYYVEHRQGFGYDSGFSTNSNLMNGVLIHTGSESTPDSSYLLDMTPATSSWFDPALGVGQSYTDPDAGVTITVLSADTTGASVSVSFGTPQCTPADPSVTLTGGGAAVLPGTTVTYNLTVRNNDFACGASTFNVAPAVPSGWASTLTPNSVTLNSGASQTLSLRVTSPATAADGSYDIAGAATRSTDPNAASSATTTYQVNSSAASGSSVTLSVTTKSSVYTLRKSVTITGHASSGGLAKPGLTISFSISKPDGSAVSLSGVTKKSGSATIKYRTTALDPVGAYWVSADTPNAGSPGGLVTTSFVVQ